MLRPATLNRVSHSYRRGYYDGYDQKPNKNMHVDRTDSGLPMKPFSDHDYQQGYKAGLNDFYWPNFRSGKISMSREDFFKLHGITL